MEQISWTECVRYGEVFHTEHETNILHTTK